MVKQLKEREALRVPAILGKAAGFKKLGYVFKRTLPSDCIRMLMWTMHSGLFRLVYHFLDRG